MFVENKLFHGYGALLGYLNLIEETLNNNELTIGEQKSRILEILKEAKKPLNEVVKTTK